MRLFLIVLFVLGLGFALTVYPDYFGVKDSGAHGLDSMEVVIAIDCGTKELAVMVREEATGKPIKGARAYLFYTDYKYQLIATGETGSDGRTTLGVIGNINYLTALFILRVDSQGFMSREIEFAYAKCFEEQPAVPPPEDAPPADEEPVEEEIPLEKDPEPDEAEADVPVPELAAPIAPPPEQPEAACLPALMLALLLAVRFNAD